MIFVFSLLSTKVILESTPPSFALLSLRPSPLLLLTYSLPSPFCLLRKQNKPVCWQGCLVRGMISVLVPRKLMCRTELLCTGLTCQSNSHFFCVYSTLLFSLSHHVKGSGSYKFDHFTVPVHLSVRLSVNIIQVWPYSLTGATSH